MYATGCRPPQPGNAVARDGLSGSIATDGWLAWNGLLTWNGWLAWNGFERDSAGEHDVVEARRP